VYKIFYTFHKVELREANYLRCALITPEPILLFEEGLAAEPEPIPVYERLWSNYGKAEILKNS
jgi:hypothetical protein